MNAAAHAAYVCVGVFVHVDFVSNRNRQILTTVLISMPISTEAEVIRTVRQLATATAVGQRLFGTFDSKAGLNDGALHVRGLKMQHQPRHKGLAAEVATGPDPNIRGSQHPPRLSQLY
jgi:hypothetical protein